VGGWFGRADLNNELDFFFLGQGDFHLSSDMRCFPLTFALNFKYQYNV